MDIFDKATQENFVSRVNNLSSSSAPKWGKMTSAQMLKHLALAYDSALDKFGIPRDHKAKFGNPVLRWVLMNLMPMPKNAPTDSRFLMKEDVDFNEAKSFFFKEFNEVISVADDFKFGISPAFGDMDKKTWGQLMASHTDHHLKQFGV